MLVPDLPCQVPRLSLSFVIGIEMVAPTSEVLVCETLNTPVGRGFGKES